MLQNVWSPLPETKNNLSVQKHFLYIETQYSFSMHPIFDHLIWTGSLLPRHLSEGIPLQHVIISITIIVLHTWYHVSFSHIELLPKRSPWKETQHIHNKVKNDLQIQLKQSDFISCKIRKVKTSPRVITAMIIHTSMKWGEQREKCVCCFLPSFYIILNYLFFFLNYLFKRHFAAFGGANIWVFLKAIPGQGRGCMWNGKQ